MRIMFCKYCGNKLDDDSVFCVACGKKLNEGSTANLDDIEKKTKFFNFSGISYNKSNVDEINTWLKNNPMLIKKISINTFMNANIPIKWETVINRVEITYTTSSDWHIYQLGFFKSMKWLGTSFDKVEKKLQQWKEQNRGKKVVWHTFSGHQRNGGTTQSVYYLYY